MALGKNLLDHIGGVGAQHDQLTVGHVDHAHDAEGDGQADGRQQQHRAQAQAEEDGVGGFIAGGAGVDGLERFFRRVAFGGGVGLRGAVAQHVLHRGFQAASHRVDGGQPGVQVAVRVAQHGDAQGGVDGVGHGGILFLGLAFAQGLDHRRVGAADQPLHRLAAAAAVRVGERGHRLQVANLFAQPVVDDHRAGGAGVHLAQGFTGERVGEGPAAVGLLAQGDAVVGTVVDQPAIQQCLQQGLGPFVAGARDGFNGRALDVEVAAFQVGERVAHRGRVRRRRIVGGRMRARHAGGAEPQQYNQQNPLHRGSSKSVR